MANRKTQRKRSTSEKIWIATAIFLAALMVFSLLSGLFAHGF